jgi:hypothetical protein
MCTSLFNKLPSKGSAMGLRGEECLGDKQAALPMAATWDFPGRLWVP